MLKGLPTRGQSEKSSINQNGNHISGYQDLEVEEE